MLNSLISHLAPHYCLSCGEIGEQICNNCYFDIELSPRSQCFVCHQFLVTQRCLSCHLLQDVTQLVLAEREGVLARLIDEYKFSSTRDTKGMVARLLDDSSPLFPSQSCLVPVPTAPAHVRQRGFDHTYDFTKQLAKKRNLTFFPHVRRRHNAAQVGASHAQRQKQANQAYALARGVVISPDYTYIICDDIVTTGASMTAMVNLLRSNGAKQIICLALLQQPWQK